MGAVIRAGDHGSAGQADAIQQQIERRSTNFRRYFGPDVYMTCLAEENLERVAGKVR